MHRTPCKVPRPHTAVQQGRLRWVGRQLQAVWQQRAADHADCTAVCAQCCMLISACMPNKAQGRLPIGLLQALSPAPVVPAAQGAPACAAAGAGAGASKPAAVPPGALASWVAAALASAACWSARALASTSSCCLKLNLGLAFRAAAAALALAAASFAASAAGSAGSAGGLGCVDGSGGGDSGAAPGTPPTAGWPGEVGRGGCSDA